MPHYRNLRAFLCPSIQTTGGDDVIASDFLDSSEAKDVGDPDELVLDKPRIDKLLAHISYERSRYEASGEKTWSPEIMVQRLRKGMESLMSRLPHERRDWFSIQYHNGTDASLQGRR